MTDRRHQKPIPSPAEFISGTVEASQSFPGFKHLSANFTYTPNQFFDVCLPHYSRGVVRLVAYMIRQTLGYCDPDGRPQMQRVTVTYSELVERAAIARGAIRETLGEAIEGKFLRCVQTGSPNRNGQRYTNAAFELRWDGFSADYVKDPRKFKGFYEGEGNRTDIPNQYFDIVIPNESLSVIKVVGSILRFSIGYQTRQGGRRQQVALSYKDIQNYARMGSPRHLSTAIQEALRTGYIVRLEDGFFDTNRGKQSKAATYSVRWEMTATYQVDGSKREAGKFGQERFKKGSGNGSKREAAERSIKGSDIQTKGNKTSKQQQRPATVAAEDLEAFNCLTAAGFDQGTAERLAVQPPEHIKQQLEWLPRRGATRNPLGMLRKAIEEGWGEPVSRVETSQLSADSSVVLFVKYFYASFGKNEGEPAVSPSHADLDAAVPYVERLLNDWPNRGLVPDWGRAFGRLCLAMTERNRPPIISFAAMLRSYGDEFAVRNHAAKRNQIEDARNAALAQRQRELTPAWFAYLQSLEAEYRELRAKDYMQFEKRRTEERQKYLDMPGKSIKEAALRSFDSTESRLKGFQQFFQDEVLDFLKWEATQAESVSV